MNVVIKITPESYRRLRDHVPNDSAAHEAVETAARIEHAVEGVLFAGYSITCDEAQARLLLDIAKRCCPEVVVEVEKALNAARNG